MNKTTLFTAAWSVIGVSALVAYNYNTTAFIYLTTAFAAMSIWASVVVLKDLGK